MGNVLDGMQYISQQGELGRQRGEQNKLAGLVSQAMQAPQQQRGGLLGQMAAVNPQAAFNAQAHLSQMDDSSRKRLGEHAMMFDALPDDQKAAVYPQLAQEAKALGIPAPDQWDPSFAQGIKRLAQAFGGMSASQADGFTLGPGAARYDANGRQIAAQPFAPANGQVVNVPDGQGGTLQMIYDPRSGQFSQPNYGGQPSGGAPQVLDRAYQSALPPQQVQSTIQQLAQKYGGQISSLTRTPEHNREVGGVPNSQHIRGTAGDVVIRDPAQKAAYMRDAQAAGLQVIDEGDHLHTQLPRGARLGYNPPKPSATDKPPVGYRYSADGTRMEAIPGGPADKTSPNSTTTGGANAQKLAQANAQKMAQFTSAERAINRLDEAAKSLSQNKVFDGGPLDQFAIKYTKQGQEIQQASAALLPILTALTRVPGIGAQSDWEGRLQQMQMPSAEFAPEVNARAVKALREYMRDLKSALQSSAGPTREQNTQDTSLDALLDKYK